MLNQASPLPSINEKHSGADLSVSFGLFAVVLFFIASGFISYWNIRVLSKDEGLVTKTHEIIIGLDELLSLVKDAETGQRGYLLTGNIKYLDPYNEARSKLSQQIAELSRMVHDSSDELARLSLIKDHIAAKMAELAETVDLRRTKGFDAALADVVTDRGKNEMDIIRQQVRAVGQEQEGIRQKRLQEMDDAYRVTVGGGIMTGFLGIFISCCLAYLIRRAAIIRRNQEWLQDGVVGLSKSMLGDQRMEQLGESILKFMAEYLDAQAGVFFTKEGSYFRRTALYGIPSDSKIPGSFHPGEGLPGQAAKDGRAFLVHDIPEDYLTVGSALGQRRPRHLFIAPAIFDGAIVAIIELGFFHAVAPLALQLLTQASASIGVAVRSAIYRENLQRLLEETQRQAEEFAGAGRGTAGIQ